MIYDVLGHFIFDDFFNTIVSKSVTDVTMQQKW